MGRGRGKKRKREREEGKKRRGRGKEEEEREGTERTERTGGRLPCCSEGGSPIIQLFQPMSALRGQPAN